MNYYEELKKLSVTELEAQLRSLRGHGDKSSEETSNPYTRRSYQSYRNSLHIDGCRQALAAKRAEALNAQASEETGDQS